MFRFLLCSLLALLALPALANEPKTLRYGFEVAETGFDPAQVNDIYSRIVTCEIFDAPLRYAYLAPAGTVEPATATALPEISPDFKTLTVHIKPGIYFTDDPAFNGKRRELVAEDYVYSYKRYFDPRWNSPNIETFEPAEVLGLKELREEAIKTGHFDYDKPIEGLRALDRYTLQIRMAVAQPRFYYNLADASVAGAVAREVVEKYGDAIMEHPVGTGSFKLESWVRSSRMVLVRNPEYREDIYHGHPDPSDTLSVRMANELEGRRLPIIDRVEISVIEENQPRWLSFLNGEYDLLYLMPYDLANLALPNGRPAPNLAKRHIQVERVPRIDVAYILYNMDDPVIGGYTPEKVALRRAINLGYDTNEIIRTYFKMQAFPAQSMILPMTSGYDPSLRSENGITDLPQANALLDEFGYRIAPGSPWRSNPDGSPLVITFTSQPDQHSRIREEIFKKSLASLHIQSDSRIAKWPENLKAARAGKFMVWQLGSSASTPDTNSSFLQAYGPATGADNIVRFKSADFDRLYRQQDALADGPERLVVLRQMQRILTAYAPMKLIAHTYQIDMTYPWVKNYRHWPFMNDNWRYLDIDQALQAPALQGR